jgi:type II secretory ATPase GspE/PulE/Tfp pilus assembly ATPase PilB-like protein
MEILPRSYAESHNLLPITTSDDRLVLAAERFTDLVLLKEVEQLSGCSVVVLAASGDNIRETRHTILKMLEHEHAATPHDSCQTLDDLLHDLDTEQISVVENTIEEDNLEASASQSPIISLVNQIIKSAVRAAASDIHIEPCESHFLVRFRIDGDLTQFAQPPAKLLPTVVSRIKIMAELDISERRLPQDGAISITLGEKSVDLRVSTMTARFGEKVVIRIIERDERPRDLSSLGMRSEMLCEFRQVITQPNGIALVTGPTGSGKTSTLYAALSELVTERNNVSTIEDPVERVLRGVNQFQVHPKAGFTFAGALRAMLRQDPNIIMVGEIRDTETAQLATEAALTGHLVLSTLHTNDALTAIPRLINMGVEPYLVAATLRGVIAQRLVKRLCPSCKTPAPLNDTERTFLQCMEFDPTDAVFAKGSGCQRCDHRGTRGRIGVYELVTLTEMMTSNVIRSLGQEQASNQSVGSSRTFWKDGIAKALAHEIPLNALMQILSTTSTQPLPLQSATRFAA